MKMKLFADTGYLNNESSASSAASIAKNVYHSDAWDIVTEDVLTDTAANTWCRTPGQLEELANTCRV